jgi:FkbM family methyltransferase
VVSIGATSEKMSLEPVRYLQSSKYRGTAVVIGDDIKRDAMLFAESGAFDRVVAVDGSEAARAFLHKTRNADADTGTPIEILSKFVSNRPEMFLNLDTCNGRWFVTEVPIGPASARVSATTLDDVCVNMACVSIVKIDADARELEILESGPETLGAHRPDLCIETYPGHTDHISRFLETYGYLKGKVLSGTTVYFVYVGRIAVSICRMLSASPFWIASRSVWRWERLAFTMVMARRRWRQ